MVDTPEEEVSSKKPRKRKPRQETSESVKQKPHSVYKGVSYRKQDGRYVAYVQADKTRALGNQIQFLKHLPLNWSFSNFSI